MKQLRYIDAMKILLTDEPFDAQEALRIGLVNEVVPHAQLLARAEKIAPHICTLPPVAVRMMKESSCASAICRPIMRGTCRT